MYVYLYDVYKKYHMLKTWIEDENENGPLFKIEFWNHWKLLETRTNNTNEGYNFRLTVKMGSQIHSSKWDNIFIFNYLFKIPI
jgi:hypothetical protein